MMESALWRWHSESVTFYLLFSSSLLEQIEMLLLLCTCPLSWAHNHWQWILAASSPPYLRGKKKLLSYVVAHSCSMRPRWCNKMGARGEQDGTTRWVQQCSKRIKMVLKLNTRWLWIEHQNLECNVRMQLLLHFHKLKDNGTENHFSFFRTPEARDHLTTIPSPSSSSSSGL